MSPDDNFGMRETYFRALVKTSSVLSLSLISSRFLILLLYIVYLLNIYLKTGELQNFTRPPL